MVKANELRIGNWVLFNGEPAKVLAVESWALMIDKLTEDLGIPGVHQTYIMRPYEKFQPIPLTPELLEKIGLKDNNDGEFYRLTDETLIGYTGNVYFETPDNITFYLLETKYIHQLQNLYFSLTGEELIIDL